VKHYICSGVSAVPEKAMTDNDPQRICLIPILQWSPATLHGCRTFIDRRMELQMTLADHGLLILFVS